MPPGSYARPPITEAVIDIQFDDPLSGDQLRAVEKQLQRHFPSTEPLQEIGITLTPAGPSVKRSAAGFKFSAMDPADIVLVKPTAFANSRLAPYQGWAALVDRTRTTWSLYKKAVGYRRISRVATRYINRIDIPVDEDGSAIIENYVTIGVAFDNTNIGRKERFALQLQLGISDLSATCVVNATTTESPLVGHVAVIIDIDLFRTEGIPQRDKDMWEYLEELRRRKNVIFEQSITERAREVFDAPFE
jgi:uncharacterized protein (TIGR04255 family)